MIYGWSGVAQIAKGKSNGKDKYEIIRWPQPQQENDTDFMFHFLWYYFYYMIQSYQ